MAKLSLKNDQFRHFCTTALFFLLSAFLFEQAFRTANATPPKLALAQVYQKDEDLSQYWVSEKLDGVRAYWDGKQLISKQGNPYFAPAWFTDNFPETPLDGELWIGRNRFEKLVSTVTKLTPVDSEWHDVKYMLFDLPASPVAFTERLDKLADILKQTSSPYLHLIHQYRVSSHADLEDDLTRIIEFGGEGLMLHRADSFYRAGRSGDILKVKTHQDAEAIVIAHLPGKGKYQGMLGALLVEMPDGKRFKIGSGFKDTDRKTPPKIGAQITYKYFGFTRKGIPRFASYLRVRKNADLAK